MRRSTSKASRARALAPALLATVVGGCGKQPGGAEAAAPAPVVAAPAPSAVLERVAVVGASASGGFGTQMIIEAERRERREAVRLSQLIDAARTDPDGIVSDCANVFFFFDPTGNGATALACAAEQDPTLIVAIDYLFWYGYGALAGDGGPIRAEADRLELLEQGLASLDAFACPIVIGDFPDMSPAIGRMLAANQVPEPRTLRALNERLHAWAATRPRVVILPLADFIASIRAGGPIAIGAWTWTGGAGSRLLQSDELHPTFAGLTALVRLLVESLVEEGTVRPDEFDADDERIAQRVAQALSATREGG